ncbi:MAG: MerR family transcriptional regulator [Myxococcota bacterium]
MSDQAQTEVADGDTGGDGCSELLTTGDMARLTGSTLRTVRFYEQEGLLEPASRNGGGHRFFRRDQLHKLQFILDLREAGLSLHDIRALLELKRGSPSAEEASRRMSGVLEEQLAQMQRKITLLRKLRDELASTVYAIRDCRSCKDERFPSRCCECEVMQQPDPPRALHVLWNR